MQALRSKGVAAYDEALRLVVDGLHTLDETASAAPGGGGGGAAGPGGGVGGASRAAAERVKPLFLCPLLSSPLLFIYMCHEDYCVVVCGYG